MAGKSKAVAKTASEEALAALDSMAPQAESYNRAVFPKLVFKSQTVLDDDENVVIKAGTFFIEEETDEEDENGKTIWDKKELGKSLKGHIIFHRKRLQMWDADEEVFYSTPMYDEPTDVIPLFKAGEFVAEGTPGELKALFPKEYEYEDRKTGEKKTRQGSLLKDAKVLYVIVDSKLLELTLTGTSLWSFQDFLKKNQLQRGITTFNSTKEERGTTKWNKMSFKLTDDLTQEQAELAVHTLEELKEGIEAEKAYYAAKRAENGSAATALPTGAAEALPAGEEGEGAGF